MVKSKLIKVSEQFHRKIMKMKYNLGYNDAEDVLKSLVKIAESVKTAAELKKK